MRWEKILIKFFNFRSQQGWSPAVQRAPVLVQLAGQRQQREERQVGLVQRQELLQEEVHGPRLLRVKGRV